MSGFRSYNMQIHERFDEQNSEKKLVDDEEKREKVGSDAPAKYIDNAKLGNFYMVAPRALMAHIQ